MLIRLYNANRVRVEVPELPSFMRSFGYEAVVSGSKVAGEVFALPTMLPDTVAMNAT
jgi:hypothetical protein